MWLNSLLIPTFGLSSHHSSFLAFFLPKAASPLSVQCLPTSPCRWLCQLGSQSLLCSDPPHPASQATRLVLGIWVLLCYWYFPMWVSPLEPDLGDLKAGSLAYSSVFTRPCSIDHRGEEQDHLMGMRDGGSKLKSREMKREKEGRGRKEKDIRGRRVGGGCRDDWEWRWGL